MNPASSSSSSSSDDDSSSSSSSRSSREGELYRAQRRADIEPVDSSDDGSSDDGEYHHTEELTNFDDLPTDDSEEDDSDSDDDSDDGSVDSSNEKQRAVGKSDSDDDSSIEEEQGIPEEDVPLSERVATKAREGRRYYTGEDNNNATSKQGNDNNGMFDDSGKKRRAERKSKAIELASERLKEVRKGKKKEKKQQQYSDDDDDEDDSSVEQATSTNSKGGNTGTVAKTKKKSKHAPTEISSKRRDYFARGRPDLNSSGIGVSIGANKYKARDPRMVSLSGHLDADQFEKRYGFLDEVQEQEIDTLKKRVNAWKTSGKKGQRARKKLGITNGNGSLEDDQEELKRLLQERAERKRANVVRAAKKSVKQKIRQDVASGKRAAYYPKRSELKRMEAEAKYTEIRKRGGDEAVDKAIAKRRKKNMSKEAKSMPNI